MIPHDYTESAPLHTDDRDNSSSTPLQDHEELPIRNFPHTRPHDSDVDKIDQQQDNDQEDYKDTYISEDIQPSEDEEEDQDTPATTTIHPLRHTVDSSDQSSLSWIKARLHKQLLPLSAKIGELCVAELCFRFCRIIKNLQVVGMKSNSRTTLQFKDADIVDITNFFFDDLIGPRGSKRLSTLIETCAIANGEAPDIRSAVRARDAANDPSTPEIFRRFFSAYSQAAGQTRSPNEHLEHIRQVKDDLAFLKEYNVLKERAEAKDSTLITFLNDYKIETKPG